MKFVAVLMCLNPSSEANAITEYTFYQAINPVATVKNIKIIKRDKPIKAFVQLENNDMVEKVVKHFHGQELAIGKFKVFKSDKTFIALEKTLKQIIRDGKTEPKLKENDLKRVTRSTKRNSAVIPKSGILCERNEEPGRMSSENSHTGEVMPNVNEARRPRALNDLNGKKGTNKVQMDPNGLSSNLKNSSNKEVCRSEMIARGSKRHSADQTSIYVKGLRVGERGITNFLDFINSFGEIIDVEFEKSKDILFIDFESKLSAYNAVKALNKRVYDGRKLTVELCESFSSILDASQVSNEEPRLYSQNKSRASRVSDNNNSSQELRSMELHDPPQDLELETFALIVGSCRLPQSITEARHKTNGKRLFTAVFAKQAHAIEVSQYLKDSKRFNLSKKLKLKPL